MAMGSDLLAILKEARVMADEDARKPQVRCPICGNYLDVNERGEKNCDVGHYRAGVGGA